jgi:transcriptional regulator with XRE-family HTH domain
MIAPLVGHAYQAEFMINPAMIRAARALLGWKQTDLAKASGVNLVVIKDIERSATDPRLSTIVRIEHAFEAAGIRFFNADHDGGPGLRLNRPPPKAEPEPENVG